MFEKKLFLNLLHCLAFWLMFYWLRFFPLDGTIPSKHIFGQVADFMLTATQYATALYNIILIFNAITNQKHWCVCFWRKLNGTHFSAELKWYHFDCWVVPSTWFLHQTKDPPYGVTFVLMRSSALMTPC
jgi:hypothetical protein